MVDKTDPGEQYGGVDPGARIKEALQNVGSILSRAKGATDVIASRRPEEQYEMLSYIRESAPATTYRTPSAIERAAGATARYAGMAAEEGLNKALSGFQPYTSETPAGRGAMNVYDTEPTTKVGAANNFPGTYPIYPQPGSRGSTAVAPSMMSNIADETVSVPTGYYTPAVPPAFSVARPTKEQRQAFVGLANFDTSSPEANAYKGAGPREYGGIDYISYAADMLANSEVPYPEVAYAVASSETNRGRTTQIKGQIPLNPDGSYKDGAQGPWQFVPATARSSGIDLIRKDPKTGKWIDDRGDPIKSARAFVVLTNMNRENFINNFNREPTRSELYLGHLLGSNDLRKALTAATAKPNTLATKVLDSDLVRRNLRVGDKEKAALAKTITIKQFLDMHQNTFNKYVNEYPAWRASRQGKTMNIGVNEYAKGGLVGPGGMNMNTNGQPTAGQPMRFGYIPPDEQSMPDTQEPPVQERPGTPGLRPPPFSFMERRFPSYEEGGMIGPGGMPMRPTGVAPPSQPNMSSDQLEAEIQRMMQENPQAVQQIQQAIMSAMQTGELTSQELNMMVQLATVASQNPQMYPQIRQFAIQQGIATEEDLPPQYDQGLVFVILLAARASQQQAQGGTSMAAGQAPQIPQAATQPPVASMMSGGALPTKSANADGSVPIIAHEGEYVIPRDIVLKKGTEFFDKLIGKGPNATGNAK